MILPLLSSQIYQAYNSRTDSFTGTLAQVLAPITTGLAQLYQALKYYQPISCQNLDTVLLSEVNAYLSSNDVVTYQTAVQTTYQTVLSYQPLPDQ